MCPNAKVNHGKSEAWAGATFEGSSHRYDACGVVETISVCNPVGGNGL